jgi:hypothetical protein
MFPKFLKILFPSLKMGVVSGGIAAAAVGAGVGAIGSNMAAKTTADGQKAAAEAANSPWSKAQPYILDGYDKAGPLLDAASTGAYSGPRVAGLNPYQTGGATSVGDWATNTGSKIPDYLLQGGQGMMSAGSAFGSNAQNVFDTAGQDHTQQFLDTASQYANNPYVDGLIDANSRDITRNLNENQLPALNLAAAGSGNTNSTRTGVAQAIAERGASDRLSDVSNTIRSNFFSKGLDDAQTQYNTQQSLRGNVNQQLGQAYSLGTGSLTGAQQANGNNFDQTQAAGGVFQNQEQKTLDANKAAYTEGQNTNMDLLAKYMGIINGQYGGPAVTGTVANGGAAVQGALGGATAGLGLATKLGDYKNPSTFNPTYQNSYSSFDVPNTPANAAAGVDIPYG